MLPPAGVFFAMPAVAVLAVMYGPTIRETAEICWTTEDYSHGLLLPWMSLYFIWSDLPKIREHFTTAPRNFSWSGLLLLAAGMGLFLLGALASLHFLKWLAFFPSLLGVLFLFFSRQAVTPLVIPIVLNFMAKPLPDAMVPKLFFPLQVLAARVSASVLELLDVPVYLRGNVIEIPGMQLMVEEACSGLRSMMALITVALVVLYTVPLRWYGQLLLLTLSVGVAILLNVVRVASTGLLAHSVDPAAASGFFHTFSGLVTFVLGLGILFSLAKLLARYCGRHTSGGPVS